jgi:hypothetical protein
MERFSFSDEASADLSEIPLSTLSAEIAARKIEAATQEQPFIQTVVETDGLTPLLNIIIGHALPLI